MKKLVNLKGAKALNKKEQQSVNGGARGNNGCCNPTNDCCIPKPIPVQLVPCVIDFSPNCQYAYGDRNCPNPEFLSGCI